MEENTFLATSVEATQKIAEDFGKKLKPGDIVLLYGDLGSGKTTFVQGIAKGLGIKQRIISPTFIVARSYDIAIKNAERFYHIDLYRVVSAEDLESFGIINILQDKNAIIAVEWAEKLGGNLPEDSIKLFFEQLREDERRITIKNG